MGKNLAEYLQRSAAPTPTTESNSAAFQSQQISFQELYERSQNLDQNQRLQPTGGKLSFDAIRESIQQMRKSTNNNRSNVSAGINAETFSLLNLKNSLKSKTQDGSRVIGGTQGLPVSVFGREMKEGVKGGKMHKEGMKMEFVNNLVELGEKLRQLRAEGMKKSGGGGFSLEELNERLMAMEEKDNQSRIGGFPYRELRESLQRPKISGDEKQKKSSSYSET